MPLFDLWYCMEDDSYELVLREDGSLARRMSKCTLLHAFEAGDLEAARKHEQELLGFGTNVRMMPGFPTRRVEDGATQHGDDWPGLFLRGDSAFYLAVQIKTLESALNKIPDLGVEAKIALRAIVRVGKDIDRDVYQSGPRIWPKDGTEGEKDELPDRAQT